MRPAPFTPEPCEDPRFWRDPRTGAVWHRAFYRTLYADTDRSGVVYHANYLRYFEFGRASLMRDVGFPYAQVEDEGFVYPIVDMGLQFRSPLRYDSPMWVHTRPATLERVRLRFDYIITHADCGTLACLGHTTHCALGPKGLPVAVDPTTCRMWETFPR